MKKTYIEPNNTVVVLNTEKMVCDSYNHIKDTDATSGGGNPGDIEGPSAGLARESINTWEEW